MPVAAAEDFAAAAVLFGAAFTVLGRFPVIRSEIETFGGPVGMTFAVSDSAMLDFVFALASRVLAVDLLSVSTVLPAFSIAEVRLLPYDPSDFSGDGFLTAPEFFGCP